VIVTVERKLRRVESPSKAKLRQEQRMQFPTSWATLLEIDAQPNPGPGLLPCQLEKEKKVMNLMATTGSRGCISASRLFSLRELGISNPELHLDRVIAIFLSIGEAVAARWIQMPKAILLLQMAPDNPSSGAIYFYDRRTENFYLVCFEHDDDTLTTADFTDLLNEYDLLKYAENPERLYRLAANVGAA
jgi:hypothetical protein